MQTNNIPNAEQESTDPYGTLIKYLYFRRETTPEEKEDFDEYDDPDVPMFVDYTEEEMALLIDGDEVILDYPEYKLLIDYPLKNPDTITFTPTRPVTRKTFLEELRKEYLRIYEEEGPAGPYVGNSLNRPKTNGKYGIWGHVIGDLVMARASVYRTPEEKILVALDIDS